MPIARRLVLKLNFRVGEIHVGLPIPNLPTLKKTLGSKIVGCTSKIKFSNGTRHGLYKASLAHPFQYVKLAGW